nr:CdaR family protein [Paenibacillus shirakamiensis]
MVHLDSGATNSPVTSNTSNKIINDIRIQVYGLDDKEYVLTGLDPAVVRLEVKGKRSELPSLLTDYKVRLNLENVGPGTTTVPLTYELPLGVELVSMEPSSIRVTIENKVTKDFTPTITTKGTPTSGLEIGTPVLTKQESVSVTLPESDLNRVDKIQGTIDVSGLEDAVKGKSVKLKAYDKKGREIEGASISPNAVNVDVPVNKLYKTVPIELSGSGSLPEGFALAGITTEIEGVAIYGSKEALEGIHSYKASVDLSKFKGPDTSVLTIDLTPPDGFEKIEPSSIQVVVKASAVIEQEVRDVPVTIVNTNSSLDTKVLTPSTGKMTLKIKGSTDVLKSIRAEDIKVSVDVSNLTAGRHTLTPKITLPKFVTLSESGNMLNVEVELLDTSKPTTTKPTTPKPNGDTTEKPGQGTNNDTKEPDSGATTPLNPDKQGDTETIPKDAG